MPAPSSRKAFGNYQVHKSGQSFHSHMLDEQPRLFFLHFWANDDAVRLAKGLRAALDKIVNEGGFVPC
jgi:hypothetical protein